MLELRAEDLYRGSARTCVDRWPMRRYALVDKDMDRPIRGGRRGRSLLRRSLPHLKLLFKRSGYAVLQVGVFQIDRMPQTGRVVRPFGDEFVLDRPQLKHHTRRRR